MVNPICGTPYLRVWFQDYNSACEPGHLWNALPEGLVPRLQQCSVSRAICGTPYLRVWFQDYNSAV